MFALFCDNLVGRTYCNVRRVPLVCVCVCVCSILLRYTMCTCTELHVDIDTNKVLSLGV